MPEAIKFETNCPFCGTAGAKIVLRDTPEGGKEGDRKVTVVKCTNQECTRVAQP
jgi:hypothetical protein